MGSLTFLSPGYEGGAQPSSRAITERLYKLAKATSSEKTRETATTPQKSSIFTLKSTPKKATASKMTPTSSKKLLMTNMSDVDDGSEDEAAVCFIHESLRKRQRYERYSKKRKYCNEEDGSDGEANTTVKGTAHPHAVDGGSGSIFDESILDQEVDSGATNGWRGITFLDETSNISNFKPSSVA